jgi:hypothetical protein
VAAGFFVGFSHIILLAVLVGLGDRQPAGAPTLSDYLVHCGLGLGMVAVGILEAKDLYGFRKWLMEEKGNRTFAWGGNLIAFFPVVIQLMLLIMF